MRLFKKYIIALYFLLCPMELALNILFTSSTKYVGMLILAVWVVEIIYNRDTSNFNGWKHILILLAWTIYELVITLTIGVTSDRTYEYMVTYLMMTALVVICSQEEWDALDINLFLYAYYLGSIIMAIIVIAYGSNVYEGRSTIIIMGRYCDPNQLSASVLPGVFIGFEKSIKEDGVIKKTVHLLAVMVVIYGILSTGSRGALLGFLAGFTILLSGQIISGRLRLYHIGILVIGATIILRTMPSLTLDRLRYSDNYLYGSGRSEIWEILISSFDAKWIIGHGAGSSIAYFLDYYGKASAVHNTFLLVLYESGIIGLIMFVFMLLDLLINTIKSKNILIAAILAGAMVNAFFLDSLNLRYLWNGIIICIMQYNLFECDRIKMVESKFKYIR